MYNGIRKEELLSLLYERGYSIHIEIKNKSKFITFNGTHSKEPYINAHSYSLEWTNEEIKRDVVYSLLKWTGLKIKYTLDY